MVNVSEIEAQEMTLCCVKEEIYSDPFKIIDGLEDKWVSLHFFR